MCVDALHCMILRRNARFTCTGIVGANRIKSTAYGPTPNHGLRTGSRLSVESRIQLKVLGAYLTFLAGVQKI